MNKQTNKYYVQYIGFIYKQLCNCGINSGKSAVLSGKNCPREFPRANFSDNTENFPLFFRLLDLNSDEYEAQSCPRFMSEHIPVDLQ